MKTNILHVVTGFADGGLEKVVLMLVSNMDNPDIRHFAVSLMKRDNVFLEKEFIECGVNPVYFNFDNRLNNVRSVLQNLVESFKLAAYIKKNNIRIIHSHDFFPALSSRITAVFALLFYFHKVDKIIITLHNLFFWLNRYHHFLNRVLSRITTKIVCVSQSVMEYSLTHDKIQKTKYRIIYNGVDTRKYQPDNKYRDVYRKEFGIDNSSIIMGNVGVLSLRKGQKYLLTALKNLISAHPDLKLLIFGSERTHEKDVAENIYSMIRELGLSSVVTIISPREDLNLIYNLFDIFVLPSISEGLSLSAIEAMLMKKICLFSDIGPFGEMIVEGENGFMFKSEDADDLTRKLEYIINNYKSLGYIGENARKTALDRYDINRMCKEYENLYLNQH